MSTSYLRRDSFFRAIESEKFHHGTYHSPWASGYLYSHYIILACLILVIIAIAIYFKRLQM